ncbi:cache domain-containing sensor histidine kinase [Paenibacillus jiagnxiensis]|uniref:cache domain-containing sensor histidine kinase n=1 Tax=Paenibacillus jiagnxiensis TaxID=3228926 RepID=UPI0033BAA096
MRKWSNIRFQTKLFVVFILLSSIPALLIGTMAYRKSSMMLQARNEQDLNVILAQLNTSIERQVRDFDRFTMIPYYLPDIFSFLNKPYLAKEQWGTAEIQAQRTMARLMGAYPSINSSIKGLMIYGMNGTVNGYRISGNTVINPKEKVTDEDWYRQSLADRGGFAITGVREIRQFKDGTFPALIGSRLLMDENYQPLAVMAIFISPDFIPKFVETLELPTVKVTVLDQNRNMIYASDPALAARLLSIGAGEQQGSWEVAASATQGQEGYSGVFLESGYLKWKVYLGVNREELLAGSRSISYFTFLVAAVAVICSAAISWLLARKLSRPINRLIRSMRQVEQGNFKAPAPVGEDNEMRRLESSYHRMVSRLDKLVQSIEEKERQKRNAELYALRARIQPHFLYNTLNSIRMLAILQQSSHIAKLLQALARLLQANMKLDSELVTLDEEIRLLQDYSALMDLRYTSVFTVDWDTPQECLHVPIPPMLLQPLLENAIFHGAKGLDRTLRISVTARPDLGSGTLAIEIADDGTGFAGKELPLREENGEQEDGAGEGSTDHIGLRNVHERILLRFGEPYGLSLERSEGLTKAIVNIPLKSAASETRGSRDVESVGR